MRKASLRRRTTIEQVFIFCNTQIVEFENCYIKNIARCGWKIGKRETGDWRLETGDGRRETGDWVSDGFGSRRGAGARRV